MTMKEKMLDGMVLLLLLIRITNENKGFIEYSKKIKWIQDYLLATCNELRNK